MFNMSYSAEFQSIHKRIIRIGCLWMMFIGIGGSVVMHLILDLLKDSPLLKYSDLETAQHRYWTATWVFLLFMAGIVAIFASMGFVLMGLLNRYGFRCPNCNVNLMRRADVKSTATTGVCPACNQRLWPQVDESS